VAYSTSKGGIEIFTKVAAIELAPYSIRVNCVAPGAILIERTQKEGGDYETIWGKAAPLGRVGTPADVGHAVVFLASENASYISGQTIWVDGAAFTKPNWPYDYENSDKSTPQETKQPDPKVAHRTSQSDHIGSSSKRSK